MIPLSVSYVIAVIAGIMFSVGAAIPVVRSICRAWDASGANRFGRYVFLLFVIGSTIYAGAKHKIGSVTYPYTDVEMRYLFDAGSYVTNDYVHVSFSRSPLLPNDADLLGYARSVESTNDMDWVCMLETTFAEFSSPSNIPYANAISNDFQFFTTYTPGPVVHTNGVAVILWNKAPGSDQVNAMIRTGVYTNGFRIAPSSGLTNGPSVFPLTINLNEGNQQ